MNPDLLPRPIAYVLTGGASNGAAQAGMLRATEEAGLEPDMVVGTSVGALNGAVLARRPAGAVASLIDIWSGLQASDVFTDGFVTKLRNLVRSRRYLYSGRGLRQLVATHLGQATFDDMALPFAVVATDVLGGHEVVMRHGSVAEAVTASAAIPGILPNVVVHGQLLMDGGVVANAPVHAALHLGAASIVLFDAGYACHLPEPPRHIAARLLHAMSVMLRGQVARDVDVAAGRVPVVALPPLCPMRISPLDFSHSASLIDEGYETSRRFLASIAIDGPGLYGDIHRHDGPTTAHIH